MSREPGPVTKLFAVAGVLALAWYVGHWLGWI